MVVLHFLRGPRRCFKVLGVGHGFLDKAWRNPRTALAANAFTSTADLAVRSGRIHLKVRNYVKNPVPPSGKECKGPYAPDTQHAAL